MIADPLVTNDPNRAALRAERALTFELLAARSPADVARVAARLLPASAERAWLSNVVRASLAELHREPAFKGRSPSGLERAAARTVARSAGTRWSRAKGLARLLRVAAAEVRARGTPGSGARASNVLERAVRHARFRGGRDGDRTRPRPRPRPKPRPKLPRRRVRILPGATRGAPHEAAPDTVLRVRDIRPQDAHGHWLRRGPDVVLIDGAREHRPRRVTVRDASGFRRVGHWLRDGSDALLIDI